MAYPTSGIYPDTWYPGSFTVSVADEAGFFDVTAPALATFASAAALSVFDSSAAALAVYASAAAFDSSLTGDYGDGLYGGGLYGAGDGTDYGLFDLTDAALAAFLSTPALASYDIPEPALT